MGSYQCSIYIYGILYILYMGYYISFTKYICIYIYTVTKEFHGNITKSSPIMKNPLSNRNRNQTKNTIKKKNIKTKDPSSWSTCWPLPPVNQPHAPMTCGRRRFDSPQPSLGDGSPTVKNTTWLENGTHHFNAQDFYKKSWETSTLEYLKYILS